MEVTQWRRARPKWTHIPHFNHYVTWPNIWLLRSENQEDLPKLGIFTPTLTCLLFVNFLYYCYCTHVGELKIFELRIPYHGNAIYFGFTWNTPSHSNWPCQHMINGGLLYIAILVPLIKLLLDKKKKFTNISCPGRGFGMEEC